jgi:hypothetical protein
VMNLCKPGAQAHLEAFAWDACWAVVAAVEVPSHSLRIILCMQRCKRFLVVDVVPVCKNDPLSVWTTPCTHSSSYRHGLLSTFQRSTQRWPSCGSSKSCRDADLEGCVVQRTESQSRVQLENGRGTRQALIWESLGNL